MTYGDTTGWVRPRPSAAGLKGDVILALALALAAVTTSLLYARIGLYAEPAPLWLWSLGLALATLPLALRRRYPVPVLIVVAIGFFVCGQFAVPEALIINITFFIALYTVGAWESNRSLAAWSRLIVAIAMVVWLVASLIISSSDPDAYPGVSRVGLFSAYATYAVLQIITNLLYFAGAYFFGRNSWRAAHARAVLEAQGRELERERRTSAEQAVALDRLAIARELHDVVAHHVSVMGVQAAAARMTLTQQPAQAQRSLEIVEQSAHDAITELRGLVQTLRSPEAEASGSAVGVALLPALTAESQLAGTPVTFIVTGEPRSLPLLVDVALYRVAQEALTNVRKHAGRGASAELRLRFGADRVELEVSDDGVRQRLSGGSSVGAPSGSGLGLRGMRERLGAVGGGLEAGHRDPSLGGKTGGFLVRAWVPLVASDAGQPGDTARAIHKDAAGSPSRIGAEMVA